VHYKLLGFSQSDSVRHFVFQRVLGNGTASEEYTVTADVALARKFHITLQELPSICARLLEARPENSPSETILLTDADLSLHAAANLAAAQHDAAKRVSRRSAIAAAARTQNNVALHDPITDPPSST
jgi:hypothetical protein